MKKKYLITGVSGADPYTNIILVPSIKTEGFDDKGSKCIKILTNRDDSDIPQEVKSSVAFADGPMLNILRKYIKNGSPITDIYIYLTGQMSPNKDLYQKAIESLYYDIDITPVIVFYPNDFYKDSDNESQNRLRYNDVHNFASYYKEIYEIYSHILDEQTDKKKPKIILNISSGTPAFESDMTIMSVTNNLIVEQTSKYTENVESAQYIRENDVVYQEMVTTLNHLLQQRYQTGDASFSINLVSQLITKFNMENVELELEYLNRMEKVLNTRSKKESIKEIKKIMLLESVKDSIDKKDYCGIYYSISDNSEYFYDDNKQLSSEQKELLEISQNLYFRYIGNDAKALGNKSKDKKTESEEEKLKKYYPIYNIPKGSNCSSTFLKDFNSLIEKANIMKIKSQREEINDWLLISTALLEAIEQEIVMKILNYNLDNLLVGRKDSHGKKIKSVISLEKLNQAPSMIKDKYYNVLEKSVGNFLNSYVYKNILERTIQISQDDLEKKKQLKNIICDIDIVDLARSLRVTAAHSIENVSKEEFESLYRENIMKDNVLRNATASYFSDGKNKSISCVEDAIKRLLKVLLPDTNDETVDYFEKSTKIYTSLEKRLLEILMNDIYQTKN